MGTPMPIPILPPVPRDAWDVGDGLFVGEDVLLDVADVEVWADVADVANELDVKVDVVDEVDEVEAEVGDVMLK